MLLAQVLEGEFSAPILYVCVLQADGASLSALMLSRMGMDIDEALRQYDTVGNKVFAHPRPAMKHMGGFRNPIYESRTMDEALQQVVAHGSKKEATRRKLTSDEIRLADENEFVCRT